MNNITGPSRPNIQNEEINNFTPEQIADFCNTTPKEIEALIEKGVFQKFQHNKKQPKDLIGEKEEIIGCYSEWKENLNN